MVDYPKGNKRDWNSQAEMLISKSAAGDDKAAYALLNWFQDQNWPGAPKARDYLVKNASLILPRVKPILHGNDGCWKYWLIIGLIRDLPPDMLADFRDILMRLAESQSDDGVDLIATVVLIERGLASNEEADSLVRRLRTRYTQSEIEIYDL